MNESDPATVHAPKDRREYARAAVLGLHSARYLTPSVGGCTLVNPPELSA